MIARSQKENNFMPRPIAKDAAARLRSYFEEAGYTETGLTGRVSLGEFATAETRKLPRQLERTSEPSPGNTLIRLFWLGLEQSREAVAKLIPEDVLTILLESGLANAAGSAIVPQVAFWPLARFLIASDHYSAFEKARRDLVLWPNPTTHTLWRHAIRNHSAATLDLGTGNGVIGLLAALNSDTVVASDLNPRAIEFARFNATLNGVANMETVLGDCYEPVTGRTFDLILANPPFFITPRSDFLFCQNPLELDGLCRRLVKEAPAHLNEGGYFEMLCEWAEIDGQPWQERIAEWMEGSGCDTWIFHAGKQVPDLYAETYILQTVPDKSQDAERFSEFMQYYRQRKLAAIHNGFIVMRRRSGGSRLRIEDMPTVGGDVGEAILAGFAAHDLLEACAGDEKLLCKRFRPAADARLSRNYVPVENGWHMDAIHLRLESAIPAQIGLEPLVAEFFVKLDGKRTAGEAIDLMAGKTDAPAEKVRAESLEALRKFIERGFLVEA
jgi:methylase of polypeptide subunit release factors